MQASCVLCERTIRTILLCILRRGNHEAASSQLSSCCRRGRTRTLCGGKRDKWPSVKSQKIVHGFVRTDAPFVGLFARRSRATSSRHHTNVFPAAQRGGARIRRKENMKTCFGCKFLAEKPCGDGYYTSFFCWYGKKPAEGIWELGGGIIGDEDCAPKRCEHFEEGRSVVFARFTEEG